MSFHVQKWPDISNGWSDIPSKKEAKKKGRKKGIGRKVRKNKKAKQREGKREGRGRGVSLQNSQILDLSIFILRPFLLQKSLHSSLSLLFVSLFNLSFQFLNLSAVFVWYCS